MFVVDTNVLIYAADSSFEQHESCRERIETWRAGKVPWYVTWPILYEFLRVVSHPRVLKNPWPISEAWAFVSALLAAPSLQVLHPTSRHQKLLEDVLADDPDLRGNVLHDVHTAVLMQEHGIRQIFTNDKDFRRFPLLKVTTPGDD